MLILNLIPYKFTPTANKDIKIQDLEINSIEDFPTDIDPLHLVILFEKEKPLIQSKDLRGNKKFQY